MNQVIEVKDKFSKSNQNKYILQFLPNVLDSISKLKYIKYQNSNLKSAYLIDIVHNLILRYYFKKENSFNLSSLILKEKYGFKYNYYINYLVSCNIISMIKKHLKGKNSRIYKLNEDILKSEIKRYKNYDKFLLKKSKLFI